MSHANSKDFYENLLKGKQSSGTKKLGAHFNGLSMSDQKANGPPYTMASLSQAAQQVQINKPYVRG